MGLDGLDYGPAYDIHEEQGKCEAKAHKDSLDWQLHPNTSHIHPYMYG